MNHNKLTLAITLILFSTSCQRNCVSSGAVSTLNHIGIEIASERDSFFAIGERYRSILKVTPITENIDEPISNRCKITTLELNIRIGDVIDTNNAVVTCNRNLYLDSTNTVNAGENLFKIAAFKLNSNGPSQIFHGTQIEINVNSIGKGEYRFYCTGTTTEGNIYRDSVSIYHN